MSDIKVDKQIVIDISEVKEHPEVPNVRSQITKEDVAELKKSIKERGVKNPIVVFKHGSDYFMVSGWRRRFSLLELQKEFPDEDRYVHVPAIVRTYGKDDFILEALYDNLIENIQRKDVSGYDIAERIKVLISKGIGKTEICKQIGKSITWVNETLRFLEDASEDVKKHVKAGTISLDEAKKVAKLNQKSQSIVANGLAYAKGTGNKKKKKEIMQALDETTRVRSHKMQSKKTVIYNRNVLAVLMTCSLEEKERVLVGRVLAILEWILGNTDRGLNFNPLLTKYGITIDANGNKKYEKDSELKDGPTTDIIESSDPAVAAAPVPDPAAAPVPNPVATAPNPADNATEQPQIPVKS